MFDSSHLHKFVICIFDEEIGWTCRGATEREVSRLVDMEDCHDFMYTISYINEDGDLLPVVIQNFTRFEEVSEGDIHYAYSDMVADGQVVGTVMHSDH